MSAGVCLSIGGILLSVVALICTTRPYRAGIIAALSDAELIKYGLWDECEGEPMNDYAEEFDRRQGALGIAPATNGTASQTSKGAGDGA